MKLHSTLISSTLLLLLAIVPACGDGEPCDPGQTLDMNLCVPPAAPPAEGGAGGEAGGPVEPSEEFGRVCTENSECGGPAPTCAIRPGGTEGICSVLGCDSDPDNVVCPIGWYCFTLGDACLQEDEE